MAAMEFLGITVRLNGLYEYYKGRFNLSFHAKAYSDARDVLRLSMTQGDINLS